MVRNIVQSKIANIIVKQIGQLMKLKNYSITKFIN